jgi:hypothetical protein
MNKMKIGSAAVLAFALALGIPQASDAQVTPEIKTFAVYEEGVLVGEIFRIDQDPSQYSEHWVLYPNYVYPSEKNGLSLEIRPGFREYRSTDDFFRRVPWGEGSRYVKTDCFDGNQLPVSR